MSEHNLLKANGKFVNNVFYKDSKCMDEIPSNSVHLVVTSPPYFNVKNYSLDGYQVKKINSKTKNQIGDIANYDVYINQMLQVWRECFRVLKPNGKLVINAPLMPVPKKEINSHHTRHIFNIASDIENSIIKGIEDMYLYDVYIWKRTNPRKKLMFGSYPYPRNFYAQNITEFISIFVKDGKPFNGYPEPIKEKSKLTQKEWIKFTKQVWDIPVPNKADLAFGSHCAIMPEAIVERCVRLFTFVGDIVLDPFTGSGTTLKVAKEWHRDYVGYEVVNSYRSLINKKLQEAEKNQKFK